MSLENDVTLRECDSLRATKECSSSAQSTHSIQREIALFARYKIDANNLSKYLLEHFDAHGVGAPSDRVEKLSGDLASCCSFLWFKWNPASDITKLHRADFCNHRLLCINCSRRASFVALARYWKRIEYVMKKHVGARCYSLTLTMPNTHDLAGGAKLLRASFVKLVNRGRKKNTGPFRHVLGAVRCLEVTRGKADRTTWHPHLHCIVMTRPGQRIDAKELRAEWSGLTGGRQLRLDPLLSQYDLLEVFKYTLKVTKDGEDGLSLADRALAYWQLQKTRLRASYGCFMGIPEDMEEREDEREDLTGWLNLFYVWSGSGYRLDRERVRV